MNLATRLFILFFTSTILSADAQDSCHCTRNLDSLHTFVSREYAGYADKVNARTHTAFHAGLKALRNKAQKADKPALCFKILKEYTAFYYDKHLLLYNELPEAALPKLTKALQSKMSAAQAESKVKNSLSSVEGIWQSPGQKIAVVYNAGSKEFEGIVLQSKNNFYPPGSLKFTLKTDGFRRYKARYFTGDKEIDRPDAYQYKNILYISQYALYKRAGAGADTLTDAEAESYLAGVYFEDLNDSTAYIKISTFNPAVKPVLDSLLLANDFWLSKRPHWIIDLSTNGGGSSLSYQNLLPFLYTKPYISPGNKHLVSPAHAGYVQAFLNNYASMLPAEAVAELNTRVQAGYKKPYSWRNEAPDTIQFMAAKPYPQRVSVLSSADNASAGEEFLRVAKGISTKTLIFGQPSAGYLDYGDGSSFALPCKYFSVSIPSRRANYLDKGVAYDKTGFLPDVYIGAQINDWVTLVQQYWASRK